MQKQLNHEHFGHAVMPQATHDEQAMEDHFLAMRAWTNRNVDPLDRRLLDEISLWKPILCTNIGLPFRFIIRTGSGARSMVLSPVNMMNWQKK